MVSAAIGGMVVRLPGNRTTAARRVTQVSARRGSAQSSAIRRVGELLYGRPGIPGSTVRVPVERRNRSLPGGNGVRNIRSKPSMRHGGIARDAPTGANAAKQRSASGSPDIGVWSPGAHQTSGCLDSACMQAFPPPLNLTGWPNLSCAMFKNAQRDCARLAEASARRWRRRIPTGHP